MSVSAGDYTNAGFRFAWVSVHHASSKFRLVSSQLVQASQFQVGSWVSKTCKQTVLLCDAKFRCHGLYAKLTQRFQIFGSRRWSGVSNLTVLNWICFIPSAVNFFLIWSFHSYNPKNVCSSLLAYETVSNAAYLDEIVMLWYSFMIPWCSRG